MTSGDLTGVGINAFSDKAGKGNLATSGVYGSLAYHRDLTGKGVHIFSMGIQGGMVQMGFDRSELRFGDDILSGKNVSGGVTETNLQTNSITYADINAGIVWNFVPNKKMKYYVGVPTYHLNKPPVSFLDGNEKNRLSSRVSVQGGASIFITEQWDVLPSVLYMIQDASAQVNFGTAVRYKTSADAAIRFGPWYRYWGNSDAVIFMAGMEYLNLTVGMSYDINVSLLKQTSKGRGSIEIAMIYILKSKKAIVQDISCPHF